MELIRDMEIRPGITAVIGGGGKTTFLRKVGEALAAQGHRVLLYTTTKFFPFSDLPCARSLEEVDALRKEHPLLCAGQPLPGSAKLTAFDVPMEELSSRFPYILVEADGSAQRPMKAHEPHEPVIPKETEQTIYLLGASGFGRPIAEAAHRPELYACLAGAEIGDPITPYLAASVVRAEGWGGRVFVNRVETKEQENLARRFASLIEVPVFAGSLERGELFKCGL